jgi:hypothetical protein
LSEELAASATAVTKELDTLVTPNNHGALDEGDEEKFGVFNDQGKLNDKIVATL